MTVSRAARNTPSIGLPSQANSPEQDHHVVRPWPAPRPRRTSSGTGRPGSRAAATSATPSAISALRRSSSPRLGPMSSSRSLVTSPPTSATARCTRCLAGRRSSSPVRTERLPSPRRLHDRPGEAGVGHRLAGGVDGRPAARPSTRRSRPPVNSTPKVEPADDQAGAGQDQRHRDAGQPPAGPWRIRSGSRRGEPGPDPPDRRPARSAPGAPAPAGARATSSASTRVMTSAVNSDASTPIARVTPNPRTGPEARKNSRPAASSVVTLESTMALHALANPRVQRRPQAGRRPRRTPRAPARTPARWRRRPCRWRARTRPGRAGSGWRRGPAARRRRCSP